MQHMMHLHVDCVCVCVKRYKKEGLTSTTLHCCSSPHHDSLLEEFSVKKKEKVKTKLTKILAKCTTTVPTATIGSLATDSASWCTASEKSFSSSQATGNFPV